MPSIFRSQTHIFVLGAALPPVGLHETGPSSNAESNAGLNAGPDADAAALFEMRLAALAAPLLGPEQQAHCRRFAAPRLRCLRLLARVLLRHGLNKAAAATTEMPGAEGCARRRALPSAGLGRDACGRPVLPGCNVSFAYSESAAFCALTAADSVPPLFALDAEACDAAPPAARAFAPGELLQGPAAAFPAAAARHSLRCWTVKEALLKAAGLGLSRDPASIRVKNVRCGGSFSAGPDDRSYPDCPNQPDYSPYPNQPGDPNYPDYPIRPDYAAGPALHTVRLCLPGHLLTLALAPQSPHDCRIRLIWLSCASLLHRL